MSDSAGILLNISGNIIASNNLTGIAVGTDEGGGSQGTVIINNAFGTNYIRNNGGGATYGEYFGGIGVTGFAGSLVIANSRIISNKFGGIQIGDSLFSNLSVTNNQICSNRFAGIVINRASGYFGPGNVLMHNGSNPGLGCAGMLNTGSGDGAVAVRDLDAADTVIVSGNVIADNFINTIARLDCTGTVRLNGRVWPGCGHYYNISDAVVFVDDSRRVYLNGSIYTHSNLYSGGLIRIDGRLMPSAFGRISNPNKPWGVALAGGVKGVIVRNCQIYSNNRVANNTAPGGGNLGGGILVAANVEAEIYSNDIRNNGVSKPAAGAGGSAGVVMRCARGNARLWKNRIHDNRGDGVDINGGNSNVGVAGLPGNYIYRNGRFGVGLTNSGSPNIAYNYIYQNSDNGIGISANDGYPQISYNTIYSNALRGVGLTRNPDNPGLFAGSITVNNNTIRNNIDIGIGIYDFSGTAVIDSNLLLSNNSDLFNGADPGAIGIDGADAGFYATIKNNILRNNVAGIANNWSKNPPAGIGIRGGTGISVIIDNNILWSNNGEAAIAFKKNRLTADPGITITRNQILKQVNGEGIRFTENGGLTNTKGKVSIGTPNEAPRSSNRILVSGPGETGGERAVAFRGNNLGAGLDVLILNNRELYGGIIFDDDKLDEVSIQGNECLCYGADGGSRVNGYRGPTRTAVYFQSGSGNGNIPVTISDNGIKYNWNYGVWFEADLGMRIAMENNHFYSNGYSAFKNQVATAISGFIFSGNRVEKNGWGASDVTPNGDNLGFAFKTNRGGNTGITFNNNIFSYNKTNGLGCDGCGGSVVRSSRFSSNGLRGVGFIGGGTVTVESSRFYKNGGLTGSNSAYWMGIGCNGPAVTIKNCLVYSNLNKGVGIESGTANIYFNTVANNSNYGIYRANGTANVKDCIIWSNGDDLYQAVATYSDIQDADPGTGNLSQNPLFVDATGHDYHISANSPCIDQGAAIAGIATDIDNHTRPYDDPNTVNGGDGSTNDMGADERVRAMMW